jgi:hypothetical protein
MMIIYMTQSSTPPSFFDMKNTRNYFTLNVFRCDFVMNLFDQVLYRYCYSMMFIHRQRNLLERFYKRSTMILKVDI